jgi:hypothetical protein
MLNPAAKVYGQTSRDMRRLGMTIVRYPILSLIALLVADSVTRSPLYSIYGETIAGVTILRAFGASSKFLRDMLRCVDTVSVAVKTSPSAIHRHNYRTRIRTIGCGEVRVLLGR